MSSGHRQSQFPLQLFPGALTDHPGARLLLTCLANFTQTHEKKLICPFENHKNLPAREDFKVTYFNLCCDPRTTGRYAISPSRGPRPPRGSTGGSFHAEPSAPTACPGPASQEQRLHGPRAPVSSLSRGVCPLPHFSCSMVGGPRGPSSPLGKAPHQMCPLQDQSHCPGGPAKPKWDTASCLEYCTFINAVAAQIPGRHNPPGLRINQLAARPSPSQPVSACAQWLPSSLPKLLQFTSWTQEPGLLFAGHFNSEVDS